MTSLFYRWGEEVRTPSVEQMQQALAELDIHDPEHPDAWLLYQDSWLLSADQNGTVVWQNVKEDGAAPRHMLNVPQERVLALWIALTAGHCEKIEREPWIDGNGHPQLSAEDRAGIDALQLELDRKFYDSLGPEDTTRTCRTIGCARGSINFSAFCRRHHFENVKNTRCPFDSDEVT